MTERVGIVVRTRQRPEFLRRALADIRAQSFGDVRVVVHEFAGASIPFLACSDLSVFKAFFNRSKDWVDLEEMIAARTLDIDRTLGVLVRYLGADDERVARLRELSR